MSAVCASFSWLFAASSSRRLIGGFSWTGPSSHRFGSGFRDTSYFLSTWSLSSYLSKMTSNRCTCFFLGNVLFSRVHFKKVQVYIIFPFQARPSHALTTLRRVPCHITPERIRLQRKLPNKCRTTCPITCPIIGLSTDTNSPTDTSATFLAEARFEDVSRTRHFPLFHWLLEPSVPKRRTEP